MIALVSLVCSCQHQIVSQKSINFQKFELKLKEIKTFSDEKKLHWGGFSGLQFIEKNKEGDLLFWTLTDRGPNADEYEKNGETYRPFFYPEYNPTFIKLKLSYADRTLEIIETKPFKNKLGQLITGLPPQNNPQKKIKYEIPVDLKGNIIQHQTFGVDSESLALDEKKHFWVGEEYEPSILEFDENGILLEQIKPSENDNQKLKKNQLPYAYSLRKLNRGFEALGYFNHKIFFMTQSPLETKNKSSFIRIGVFNTKTRYYEAEYLYPLENKKIDRIGDLQMVSDTHFYLIEQNNQSGEKGIHHVIHVDLSHSTNLVQYPFEKNPEETLYVDFPKNFKWAHRKLVIDLVHEGYTDFEKVEGLTLIDDQTIAVVNDNDFGISQGVLGIRPTTMGLFKIK